MLRNNPEIKRSYIKLVIQPLPPSLGLRFLLAPTVSLPCAADNASFEAENKDRSML